MREFKTVNKTFIKSKNTISKIFNRYLYSLIPFIILSTVYNLINHNLSEVINLLLSISISIITCAITQYIFNIAKKQPNNLKFLLEEQIITIAIILGLFSINTPIIITIISGVVSIIIKNINKNITTSASIYGILLILLYSYFIHHIDTPLINLKNLNYIDTYSKIVTPYGNILSYLFSFKYYLSPIVSLIIFIYLFYKKSIKYNIVITYLLTFLFIMLTFGLFNNMNIWYLFFQLTTGNILFLTVFCLTDYKNTPTTTEGQVIYGLILGLLTSILRFIIPELSVIITLVLGPILLTKLINRISFKLKYNKKYYYTLLAICVFLILITTITINVIV